MITKTDKIILTGAAGLVGQNLAILLRDHGYMRLVGIDKHPHNSGVLSQINPDMQVIEADLAQDDNWEDAFVGGRALVMLQAQIGGEDYAEFVANNITATERVLAACHAHRVDYIVHISSSVVNSRAEDYYTETKKTQERLVLESGIPCVVLRPTLMFGRFDRKHLGWLSRFMRRTPVFPIPGSGRFARQPLYILDFCRIIQSCLEHPPGNVVHDISGMEVIDYIDIIRAIKAAVGSRTLLLHIPFGVFWWLLWLYALLDRDPPFTTRQLEALVIPETFPITPWGDIFDVRPTPFAEAVRETFADNRLGDVVLKF